MAEDARVGSGLFGLPELHLSHSSTNMTYEAI